MIKKEIVEKIKDLSKEQEWNHQFIIDEDIKTRSYDIDSPGYNLNKWPRIKKIFIEKVFDRSNSFLDVGCSDGYYAIQISKCNKDFNVTGIDIDKLRIERSNFMKDVYKVSNVNFLEKDLYQLIEDKNSFDVVLGLGLLHRVPDIKKCVEDLCKVSKKFVLFEYKSLRTEENEILYHDEATKSNIYNKLYGTPSDKFVSELILNFGFETVLIDKDVKSSLKYPRSIILGEKK